MRAPFRPGVWGQVEFLGPHAASALVARASAAEAGRWQYIVYNGILRQWPEDLYQRYVKARNLFGTTIFVLVLARPALAASASALCLSVWNICVLEST